MNILDQVGKKVTLLHLRYNALNYTKETEVIMAVKAPKGEMMLFGPHKHMDDKCKAIKRFMEEHKDD